MALVCESLIWCSGIRVPLCLMASDLHLKSKSPFPVFIQSRHGHEARQDGAAASSLLIELLELPHFFSCSSTCRERLLAHARNLSQMFFEAHLHLCALSISNLAIKWSDIFLTEYETCPSMFGGRHSETASPTHCVLCPQQKMLRKGSQAASIKLQLCSCFESRAGNV